MVYEELLDKVYNAYYECRRHKKNKDSTIKFELDYERNVRKLTDDLWNRTYTIGASIVFGVTRPKDREVFAADFRDRVVHHLIMREIGDLLDAEMIEDSFSCRKGKGTQFGLKRFREQIIEVSNNYTESTYALCCDLKGFFMSIDKDKCYQMIEWQVTHNYKGSDPAWWLWLIKMVVMHRPELNCEIHGDKAILDRLPDNKTLFRSNGKGFPIGNLTSQINGNFFLTPFDKWMMGKLGNNGKYCRYVDDFRVISKDKRLLMRLLREARQWLKDNLGLDLHENKWSIQEVKKGTAFIGCVVKPWGIYAGNRLVDNAFNVARKSWLKTDTFIAKINCYMGFLVHELTYAIRWNLWNAIPHETRVNLMCVNMKKVCLRD